MSLLSKAENDSIFTTLTNGDISIEHAVVIWSNFAGRPTKFNPQGGKRTFNIVLPRKIADELTANGWNVKVREPRDEDDDPLIFTEIVLNMDSQYPPKVYLCSEFGGKKSMNTLDGSTVGELDDLEIENFDIIIHPYEHGRTEEYRIKGYANSIYATQAHNFDFGGKYDGYGVEGELPFD